MDALTTKPYKQIMTLLQQVIQVYLDEHHPDWEITRTAKQHCAQITKHNSPCQIYLDDTPDHQYLYIYTSKYTRTSATEFKEHWTHQTILQQITKAIINTNKTD